MERDCPAVGIDVAKEFSYYAILGPDGVFFDKPFEVTNDARGFKKVLAVFKKVDEAFGTKPAIVLESTGHYSLRLVHFFTRNGYKVFLVNPLQSHSINKAAIRKTKTDRVNCMELAQMYFLCDNLQEFQPQDEDLANLKVLTRMLCHLSEQRVDHINQLVAHLDQTWPGFTSIFPNVGSKTALELLLNYPSPEALLVANPTDVVELITSTARRGQAFGQKKHHLLMQYAREAQAIAVPIRAYSTCTGILAHAVQQANQQIRELETMIRELAKNIPAVGLLETIPGIGSNLAPIIAAEIGDISRFDNVKKLVAYFGVDPSVRQSGRFVGTRNSLSKRGSSYARRATFIAASVAIRQDKEGNCVNPVLREYYEKKLASKSKKTALGAIMNKLVRIIYSVLKNRRAFVLITPEQQRELYRNHQSLVAA